ncbi:hypothetical protein MSG28_005714 [Choristoneura fumiferana]|uniref:Uncharacterized protein n=1 Tax=Choristoneura fumiferana TaxID=7141 RepID=A0ACC0L0N2_CHOFU|nr:hypothetical protein MSG28_005714 [Choristoneura fumiferana]
MEKKAEKKREEKRRSDSNEEIRFLFNTTKPKITFCEVENYADFNRAAKDLDLTMKIVTFGDGDHSFAKFMKKYDDCTPDNQFRVIKPALTLSSVQWISSYLASLSMITANHIKVQTSSPVTIDHAIDIINKYKLVDPKTGEVITKPNQIGELWTKGPRFVEYYNNPEATAKAFSADGWYKTGDLLYMDENGCGYN